MLIPVRAGWFLVVDDKANTNVGLVLSRFVEKGNSSRRGVFLGLIRAHTVKELCLGVRFTDFLVC